MGDSLARNPNGAPPANGKELVGRSNATSLLHTCEAFAQCFNHGYRPREGDSAANGHLRGLMHYGVAIEPGTESSAWGVVVPDLPGCFSAGDTLDEAILRAEEAITGWIKATIDAGHEIPAPSGVEALRAAHPEFVDWLWALVKVARQCSIRPWSG